MELSVFLAWVGAGSGRRALLPLAHAYPPRASVLTTAQAPLKPETNVGAFAAQPLYTLGNVGRNTMYGPPMKDLDFSAFKDFQLRERTSLQFRAEVFNILNHPNFGMPASSLGASNFGVISSTGNYLPRNIQLALKLLF